MASHRGADERLAAALDTHNTVLFIALEDLVRGDVDINNSLDFNEGKANKRCVVCVCGSQKNLSSEKVIQHCERPVSWYRWYFYRQSRVVNVNTAEILLIVHRRIKIDFLGKGYPRGFSGRRSRIQCPSARDHISLVRTNRNWALKKDLSQML